MFPDLPPFADATREVTDALREAGRPGGIMDAGDDLAAGAQALGTDPALSVDNPDLTSSVAGLTFVGQFIDHDLTHDAGSRLGRPTPVGRSHNLRTPRFDLDSVYAGGPERAPALWADDRTLVVGSGGAFEDVPRDDEGLALIGDDRNDENLMVSGFHAAMLRFHNAVAERMRDAPRREIIRNVRWHWQWVVLHEVLPAFVGPQVAARATSPGAPLSDGLRGRIPVEFQTSAYRFGHSLVRPSYLANLTGDDGVPFGGLVFDPTIDAGGPTGEDPDDLRGGHRAPRRFIDWQLFFDFGDGAVQRPKRIDTTISSVMMDLPVSVIDSPRGQPLGPTSLPARNLLRHLTWQVPSGQAVARRMGEAPLAEADLADIGAIHPRLGRSTPLWFYILREADLLADGAHLGPVGGRIVAEVWVDLLRRDEGSVLHADPAWTPTLPTRDVDAGFTIADILTIAEVDPGARAG